MVKRLTLNKEICNKNFWIGSDLPPPLSLLAFLKKIADNGTASRPLRRPLIYNS